MPMLWIFFTSVSYTHLKLVWRCTVGICHIVLIRRETSQRYTDEVYQVSTSESHSQGESTHPVSYTHLKSKLSIFFHSLILL